MNAKMDGKNSYHCHELDAAQLGSSACFNVVYLHQAATWIAASEMLSDVTSGL
jgi:hypothetical protein